MRLSGAVGRETHRAKAQLPLKSQIQNRESRIEDGASAGINLQRCLGRQGMPLACGRKKGRPGLAFFSGRPGTALRSALAFLLRPFSAAL
jgi:hypothetical protein